MVCPASSLRSEGRLSEIFSGVDVGLCLVLDHSDILPGLPIVYKKAKSARAEVVFLGREGVQLYLGNSQVDTCEADTVEPDLYWELHRLCSFR